MKTSKTAKSKSSDHRVRVAEVRKSRMRARLLEAVMKVFAEKREFSNPVIDDIIAAAGVSRGTFYQHFGSIEEATNELGHQLINSMTTGVGKLLSQIPSPLLKLITSIQLRLFRGALDPVWSAFVSRTDYLSVSGKSRNVLNEHLMAARDAGEIRFDDIRSAADLVIGSCQIGLGRLAMPKSERMPYIENLSQMILLGLGVPVPAANHAIRDSTQYIRSHAPDYLDWWKDPWHGDAFDSE